MQVKPLRMQGIEDERRGRAAGKECRRGGRGCGGGGSQEPAGAPDEWCLGDARLGRQVEGTVKEVGTIGFARAPGGRFPD